MKRTINLLMAALLMLGLAQCKKDNNQNNDTDNRVDITLRLEQGGAKVHVTDNDDIAPVTYDAGDVILVGSDGKYVGQLSCEQDLTTFTGSINATYAKEGEPLQFIFVGQQTLTLPAEGSGNTFTFSLADQSAAPAVFATAPSFEDYSATVMSYTTHLKNRSALVKFSVDADVPAVTLSGLTNRLSVNWNGDVTSAGTGNIITHGTGAVRYAVVAEDQAAVTDGAAIASVGSTGTFNGMFTIPTAAYPNAYITTANMSMTFWNRGFSVTSDKIVKFSPGNLQYTKSTGKWSFMEHQWSTVETDNQDVGTDYANQDIVSLFGWGTSGYDNKYPYMTSKTTSDYGPSGGGDIAGTSYDWGVYNDIYNPSTGLTDNAGTWRTLMADEWRYLFRWRPTFSSKRYAKAVVNNVNGLILLPDDWSPIYYPLDSCDNQTAKYSCNIILASDWENRLEPNGAVFLPAAGLRDGTVLSRYANYGNYGHYWSSSFEYNSSTYYQFCLDWVTTQISYEDWYRHYGNSVRLVKDVN